MNPTFWGFGLAFCTSFVFAQAPATPPTPPPPKLAITGGTLVDLADYGKRTKDLADAVVVTDGDRIVAVGKRGEVEIPKDAKIIDAKGKFIVPGYIDGFSTQNNEAYARAHLHAGVTTIFAIDRDRRRGAAMPILGGPNYEKLAILNGYDVKGAGRWENNKELRAKARKLSPDEIRQFVHVKSWENFRILLPYYTIDPEQLAAATAAARERGTILIGELGLTSYLEGARLGVPIFVHASRYLLEIAPDDIRKGVADDAFGEGARAYSRYIATVDPESEVVKAYARELAKSRTVLMPTFALAGSRLPSHPNPWRDKVAAIIDPEDVMPAFDPKAGDNPPLEAMDEQKRAAAEVQLKFIAIHRTLVKQGARFIVGSGTDAFGVLPGAGVHTEMKMLVDIGLTPREALAAATANYPTAMDVLDYGRIAAGARADVLVLDADPTRDIANARKIGTVVLRGEVIDYASLLEKPLVIPVI